jgi:hypothetical protein
MTSDETDQRDLDRCRSPSTLEHRGIGQRALDEEEEAAPEVQAVT